MTTPILPTPTGGANPGTIPATSLLPGQGSSTFINQSPFDTRMRSISDPLGAGASPAKFDRGFMVWDVAYASSFGAGYNASNALPYVNFLFNPSTIQASYQLSNTAAQSADMYGISSSGASVAYVSLQQQMSFTIMFDRTYELWDQTGTNATSLASTIGCEADVLQMKQFTGMFAAASAYTDPVNATSTTNIFAAPLTTGTYNGQTVRPATGLAQGPQQGLMLMIPSYVYFSSVALCGASQYYGYVDAWSVQYTHYTTEMVPIRCVVDVEYTLLPNSTSNTAELNNSAVANLQTYNNTLGAYNGLPGGA